MLFESLSNVGIGQASQNEWNSIDKAIYEPACVCHRFTKHKHELNVMSHEKMWQCEAPKTEKMSSPTSTNSGLRVKKSSRASNAFPKTFDLFVFFFLINN